MIFKDYAAALLDQTVGGDFLQTVIDLDLALARIRFDRQTLADQPGGRGVVGGVIRDRTIGDHAPRLGQPRIEGDRGQR